MNKHTIKYIEEMKFKYEMRFLKFSILTVLFGFIGIVYGYDKPYFSATSLSFNELKEAGTMMLTLFATTMICFLITVFSYFAMIIYDRY